MCAVDGWLQLIQPLELNRLVNPACLLTLCTYEVPAEANTAARDLTPVGQLRFEPRNNIWFRLLRSIKQKMAAAGIPPLPNGDKVLNDMKTAFDALKAVVNIGSVFQEPSSTLSSGPANILNKSEPIGSGLFKSVCVSACGMQELVGSLSDIRLTLQKLQLSLVTLEYCILALTIIIGVSIAAFSLTGLLYLCIKCCRKPVPQLKIQPIDHYPAFTAQLSEPKSTSPKPLNSNPRPELCLNNNIALPPTPPTKPRRSADRNML